jgi:hypothetical protein
MRLFNVLTKKVIPTKGEPTTLWHKVGLIKETNSGHWYLQLFQQPDTDFFVYEQLPDESSLPEIQIEEVSEHDS